jgi:5-methylcytosine-specific restriction endonuclease McrA
MSKRISAKERGLIKGAVRRVFSRSDLRRAAIDAIIVKHSDPSRPRVKTWCKCPLCGVLDAKSNFEVDHRSPVIPVDTTLERMIDEKGWDELVNRIWCEPENLLAICEVCHDKKSAEERKLRKRSRKGTKK